MFVAASVFAPLIAILTTGESAIVSLKLAVMSNDVPWVTGPDGEYVTEAFGAVASTSTPVVFGAVKPKPALLPAGSLIVAPPSVIADAVAIPFASLSPLTIVYRKPSALVPLPET